ncbi:MAG TPA: phosphopantetheine-binding protein [Myxococcota bacterium]|nr:phosphopantetheine-binding protein [Myxococcota bacterium]HRY92821.1 phosphopantetheine-binding protein [Myxococcota bacterium]HSA19803.1 phosphopantetheine-binding protein [Myxococcota bacterium]
MDELRAELKRRIVETLDLRDVDPDSIPDDAPLFGEGLGLDSIDVLELVVMLEKDYGIRIDNKELGRRVMTSVASLADYIAENRRSSGAPG